MGPNAVEPAKDISAWSLNMKDTKNKTITLTFEVVNGNYTLTIGLDIGKQSETDNISQPWKIKIKRPSDNDERILETYISGSQQLKSRL